MEIRKQGQFNISKRFAEFEKLDHCKNPRSGKILKVILKLQLKGIQVIISGSRIRRGLIQRVGQTNQANLNIGADNLNSVRRKMCVVDTSKQTALILYILYM